MSDLGDLLRDDMLDLWRKQSTVNHALADEISQLHAENAELRDAVLALSNRIEAVTRASRAARDDLLAHETDTTHAHRV